MKQNLAISDYALVGNGQTAALVGRNGSVDWCCWPRFDSPALFCRLLDIERGGFFQLAPLRAYRTHRQYLGATSVLETVFTTESGTLRLTDFMPAPYASGADPVYPHRMFRRLECLEGKVELECSFRPRFDFARRVAHFKLLGSGAIAYGEGEALSLACDLPLQQSGDALVGRQTFLAGDSSWLVLTHGSPSAAEHVENFDAGNAEAELQQTVDYWNEWTSRCRYEGPYRDQVVRSAVVLKLLVFQRSGALLAAPTTSLPDEIGGQRNWDYRYTWLRDSGLVLDALQQLGYHHEAEMFFGWLEKLCLGSEDALRIMYRVDGRRVPDEHALDHLAGYRQSRPVREGNGATDQVQLGIYGHVLDAAVLCFERAPRELTSDRWAFIKRLANLAAERWQTLDHGPWEIRGAARHYLYSLLYSWVGLERVIGFAERHRLGGEIEYWKQQRAAIRKAILSRGYSSRLGAFTQALDTETLDATALTIPLTDFLPMHDPRVQSTMNRVQERLTANGLVYRYRQDDGLPGSDATFTLCSFWLVMNLASAGRTVEASELFEHICGHANDVDLLSEQIDAVSGELLGNFPQALSHLGLIRAALQLERATKATSTEPATQTS